MNEEKKQLLLDALNRDFVKKNKTVGAGCLLAAVIIAVLSVLTKNYLFTLIALPFIIVALFAFKNSKKFSKPEVINSLVFSEEICTVKSNELSTTGNIRYLEFSNHLRYDISFSEGAMYSEAHVGSRFYMVYDPKKKSILQLIPDADDKPETMIRENAIYEAAEAILEKDVLPGLTVSLKNMMDMNDHPIIVCNQLHQIFFLNQAAKARFSVNDAQAPENDNKETILDFVSSEHLLEIQKALLQFSEDDACNKIAGWKNEDDKQIEIFALRNNLNKLSGYYLQEG